MKGEAERMKLAHCKIDVVMLPTRRVHRWVGVGKNRIGHYPIIALTTSDGTLGLGEAPVLPTWGGDYGRYFGEDIQTTIHVVNDVLFPSIRGRNPLDLETLLTAMDSVIVGFPYAKAAIDMALHDIIGKATGAPVYKYLGGREAKGLLVCHSIGLLDSDTSAAEAKVAVREGIKAIKIKIGLGRKHDAEVMHAVRSAVGPKVSICVDANKGYRTPEEAIESIKAMESDDLQFIEQPVEGIENLAKVSRGVKTPVVADESAWTVQDVRQIHKAKAARGVSVYTTKPGGLHRAKQVLDLAGRLGLLCNVNGSCETGVGNASNIHLGVSSDSINLPNVVPVTNVRGREQTSVAGVFYRDDIVTHPFRYQSGYVYPSDRPGLGIELDESKVERYRSGRYPRSLISKGPSR